MQFRCLTAYTYLKYIRGLVKPDGCMKRSASLGLAQHEKSLEQAVHKSLR